MSQERPRTFRKLSDCVDAIIERVGNKIILGLPLGLGKPVPLVNAIYQRAKDDASLSLKIVTALSLEKPVGRSKLERNFLEPFVERQFAGVPDLDYVLDLRNNNLPRNVEVAEFFFKAGSYLNNARQQQNYMSSNYTHAARDLIANGVNVVVQMLAYREIDGKPYYSFSCNPDLSIDLEPMLHKLAAQGMPIAIVGMINRRLPFMHNHAVVEPERIDFVVDSRDFDHPLFATPNMAISPADHLIGFHASTLVRDGGTLQVGIGSLGSALVYSTILRREQNQVYRELMRDLDLRDKFPVVDVIGGDDPLSQGLYGCSEMMVDGFMYLYKAGILTREVFDDLVLQKLLNQGDISTKVDLRILDALVEADVIHAKLRARDVQYLIKYGIFKPQVEFKGGALVWQGEPIEPDLSSQEARTKIEAVCLGESLKGGVVMHGGFFLGPQRFYDMLHGLSDEEHQKFCMTSVNFINHLYDHKFGVQALKVAQRAESRFINSAMMVTLNGAVISDGLSNGKVVSGVGGQYNFVAMAHEIPQARSIIKLKSTRNSGGRTLSNIIFNYGHMTIPRHLRDIFVTEYGIADVRGKSDKDVFIELIKVADSRFQDELLQQAKQAGKVPTDYILPEAYRSNTPEKLRALHQKYSAKGLFPAFPFGCEFTEEELKIGKALKALKAKTSTKLGLVQALWRALHVRETPLELAPILKRMKLDQPQEIRERMEQKLLIAEMAG
ncbi:Acetyl-CoA hydrolase [Hahella chejuensis KCTC 2396]|uniref:Acetyl-CoA hydrolase n=1 Tax=Hahella chejuensis (strain KCTC 2396) TaxID=349521 RepID=Q2SL76_HAHCH|nr:acetyl-CoA hydrolase/transferase C-terminal domain-containing protein [Hahella chejuensis]ABC28598.1 Acetyl-CoA hydrolase [Hahella chejuensis KCTC 2396]